MADTQMDDPVSEDFPIALQRVRDEMANTPSLAWAWHCNIACCAIDEGLTHREANRAAFRFMRLAFSVSDYEPAGWDSLRKPETIREARAQRAYEAFCAEFRDPEEVPPWAALSPLVKGQWLAIVDATVG